MMLLRIPDKPSTVLFLGNLYVHQQPKPTDLTCATWACPALLRITLFTKRYERARCTKMERKARKTTTTIRPWHISSQFHQAITKTLIPIRLPSVLLLSLPRPDLDLLRWQMNISIREHNLRIHFHLEQAIAFIILTSFIRNPDNIDSYALALFERRLKIRDDFD